MTRAVIARVHHYELVDEPIGVSKTPAAFRVKSDLVVRPRGDDIHLLASHSLGQHSLHHESVEHYDPVRGVETEGQKARKESFEHRTWSQPSRVDRFIRIQIHDPEDVF